MVYCVFSLESPQRGDSKEYTQYTISQYRKENNPKLSQICNYGICPKGLKNEFEPAVVNEPSVLEPLKFYCIREWSGDAIVLGKFPVPGRPTYLEYSRARVGWLFWVFSAL